MVLFFLSFTAILIWALTIIGLINPSKFDKHTNGKRLTRLQILLFGFVGTIISLVLIVLAAPDPSHKADAPVAQVKVDNSTDIKEMSQPEAISSYEIVSDDKRENITRKVQVELAKRVTRQQLELIANEIKNADKETYERTFIMYRIKGEKSVAAWATSHFDPNLEIKFIGLNADDFRKLLSLKHDVEGEVIGEWVSPNGFTDHIVVIYKKGKQYFKQDYYVNATMKPKELVKDGDTFRYKEASETQYYVIDANDDLEYRGESGNVYLAKKLNNY